MTNPTTNPQSQQEKIYFQIILDVREQDGNMIVRDAQGGFWLSFDDATLMRDCLNEYLKHGKGLINHMHKQGVHEFLNPPRTPQQKTVRKPTPGYIYLLQSEVGHYKIGMTTAPDKRLHTFSVKLPFRVEYTCLIKTDDTRGLERELHRKFGEKRLDGEWFDLAPEDVEYIKGLAK